MGALAKKGAKRADAWLRKTLTELYRIDDVDWKGLALRFGIVGAVLLLAVVFFSPWKVLAGIIAVILAIFVYIRPNWVVLFLAAYIPFEPFLLKFVPDELYVFARFFSEVLIYVLLAAVYLKRWIDGEKRDATPLDLPFILFFLTAVASGIANFLEPTVMVLGLRQVIRFMLLFFAVVAMRPSREMVKTVLIVMFGVVLFQSALGMTQALTGGAIDPFLLPSERRVYESVQLGGGTEQFWEPGQRVFGTLGRYDQLGTFLTFFLLIGIGLAYEVGKGRFHKYAFLLFGFGSIALTLTYSRASWFGFLGGLFVIAVLLKRDKKIFWAFAGTLILIASYLLYSGVVVKYLVDTPRQTVVERFFEAFSYERWRGEYYGYGRLYWFVQTPITVVPSSPIFGHGPGTYGSGASAFLGNTDVYDELGLPYGVYGSEGYIDNNWFAIWGEFGTLGLALYVWIFVILYGLARKVHARSKDPMTRGIALGFVGALLAFAFQAMLGTYLEVRTIALYFWMFAAILVVLARKEKLR